MALRKTAIALPEELLSAVDEAASARGQSRNAFITRILRSAMRARRDQEITRRLEQIFAEHETGEEQLRVAEALDVVGTDWSEEVW